MVNDNRFLHTVRRGAGRPLVLVHGLGGNWQSWAPVLDTLAAKREVIALDLPGHGQSSARADSSTFAGLADSVAAYLAAQGLSGADLVGSSLGARLVLELARRGGTGAVVALDPGGFWRGWERTFFKTTIGASVRLLRTLRPALPRIADSAIGRTMLLSQLSARPRALDPGQVATELHSYATTPTFDALVRDLSAGPEQRGPAGPGAGPIAIGWGRSDRLCLPRQADRAMAAFPTARLHWFDGSGHFPAWDRPAETARYILENTGTSA